MYDPLRFALAAIPLASYCLLMAWVHHRRRPTLVSGASDLAALGTALTGLALVGPIELFRPEAATAQMGNWIWLFLLVFYWLWVALGVMLCRPRLVLYNATAEKVRPALAEAVGHVDGAARWAGDSLFLPTLGVRLHFDEQPWMRTTSLVASGGVQEMGGWRRLARSLGRSLASVEAVPSPRSGLFLVSACMLLALSIIGLVSDPEQVRIAWTQMSSY